MSTKINKYVIFRIDDDHPLGYSNFTEYDTEEEAMNIAKDQLSRNKRLMYWVGPSECSFNSGLIVLQNDEGKTDDIYAGTYIDWLKNSDPLDFMNIIDNFKKALKQAYTFTFNVDCKRFFPLQEFAFYEE